MGKKQQIEQSIALAFKKNDQKVMQQVYQNIFPKFRNHVFANSGDEAQAKDIFQEAFIACWRNIKDDRLDDNSNVEGYLFTIAKNKWIDHLRSSNVKKTVKMESFSNLTIVQEDNHEDKKLAEEHGKILKAALQQLGTNCKLLLQLFYFERKSMKEISREMSLAPASARNQKYRCMEKLRNLSLDLKNNA